MISTVNCDRINSIGFTPTLREKDTRAGGPELLDKFLLFYLGSNFFF